MTNLKDKGKKWYELGTVLTTILNREQCKLKFCLQTNMCSTVL